ncbi:glycosyltransferase family 39 protein [Clostridium sardiniense]|uniref:glycosyltransferase family 39 protein n=1 Tax=Clostridium sardiniense TaxID=29369 RepID=UPI003D334D90
MEMKKFRNGFTSFVTIALKPLILILVLAAIGSLKVYYKGLDLSTAISIALYGISIVLGYFLIKTRYLTNKSKIIIVLLWGFLLRLLWLINVKSVPVSDFNTMYETAKAVLEGNYGMLWGTGYIARFPHLTVMVMYMALMLKIFPNAILAMKVVNLIMGVVVIYLIYLILKEVFEKREYAIIGGLIAAVFPPLITYTGVLCTENLAIPFYLGSIYVFLLACKKKVHPAMFILAGVLLSIGNLFRMVAVVTVIAFVMYIIIYTNNTVKDKIKYVLMVVISFILVLGIASTTLRALKITENNLWRGSEPSITNVLKGTNVEYGGRWNPDDAAIPEMYNFNYDDIQNACKDIIFERLTTTPISTLSEFYIGKYAIQWSEGDLSGVFWSQLNVPEEDIIVNFDIGGKEIFQFVYALIMILVFIGLFNKKRFKNNPEINLFYITFCGYGVTYLVTEMQSRYSYIVCWLFIILAVSGVEKIKEWLS